MHLSEKSASELVRRMVETRESAQRRPLGPHLSDVVQSLVRTLRLTKTYDDDADDPLQAMFWEMGCTWEETVTRTLHRLYPDSYRPDPRQIDGLWCSPDWFRPRQQTLDEVKLTWTKYRPDANSPKLQAYLWQLKAYMHVWNVQRGCLHVGYVRGNYADRPVEFRLYVVRATPGELREAWEDLLAHGRDVGILSKKTRTELDGDGSSD